ncbi:Phenylacetone monooxygenase [Mycolicibacterium rhodesiae JS60]|nr:Phenylacetone monooxygenase [Mycolicibacterium rhodesiae JS60]
MTFDPEAVRAKYLAERDRRLVPGRAAIRDLAHDDRLAGYRADPFTPRIERDPVIDDPDVVIVGGGIAGLLAGAELRKAGVERIRIVDLAGGVGGTWYWNRYPGVMCDLESYQYLPMLEELDYVPTRRYAFGEEIRQHLQAVAERFDLVSDALFHTGITRAVWNEETRRWTVHTDRGDELSCRYYVLAVGILNLLKLPVIPGMDDYSGRAFHTARWDYEYTGGAAGEALTNLGDKTVALIGTGASGLQVLPPLAEAAKHVYVFQRTPSAIGVRDNRPTDPAFAKTLTPGWQKARMDNFQSIMLGRPVDADLTDDGWTRHYAAVQNPPRIAGASVAEFLRHAEELDFAIMEEHRQRIDRLVKNPEVAAALKPYYRYLCKRPCFHDEYFDAFNRPNVTLVDCPAGVERITERGPMVGDRQYEVDCIVYGTGFEAEVTPLQRRVGHDIVGRGGMTLAEKWADGSASLFGMMSRGFPNMFVMPAPGQQAVVTVNYTQIAVLGAEFVAGTVALLEKRGAVVFDVSAAAEADWIKQIVDTHVDPSAVMSACTPSRLNNEGDPGGIRARDTNYGKGFGDYFAYRDLLEGWLAAGGLEGLETA